MSTASDSATEILIAELEQVTGKAEIVDGKIVMMSPTGDMPSSAAGVIYASLLAYAREHRGRAYPDNVAYVVDLPHRKSFSPDASYYVGPRAGMKFLPDAPLFAVEVRSEHDYGPVAEERITAKRADYFAAGTQVVWDVDLLGEIVVKLFHCKKPAESAAFRRGETAHAEPVVPGWSLPVDELYS